MGRWRLFAGVGMPVILLARAALALHAYNRAEKRFYEIQRRKDALDARQKDFFRQWLTRATSVGIGAEERAVFEIEYDQLTRQRDGLHALWVEANYALAMAYDRARMISTHP